MSVETLIENEADITTKSVDPVAQAHVETPSEIVIPDSSGLPQRAAEVAPTLEQLEAKLSEVEKALASATKELAASAARRVIQRALLDAQVIDLESSTTAIENTLAKRLPNEEASEPGTMSDREARRVVQELRRLEPGRFRLPPRVRFGAMGMQVEPGDGATAPIADAAMNAVRTGHRTDLLRYLRMRRGR